MANQKITDLNKLLKLSKDDLFIVVDRDSKATSSSPTGETKGISAADLSTQLNEIAEGETGINFKNLKDVPDSYEGYDGGYIKIRGPENPNGPGVDFSESSGASEQTYSASKFKHTTLGGDSIIYDVGDIVRQDGTEFTKASSADETSAESIGIIKKIRYINQSTADRDPDTGRPRAIPERISIVFNGAIEWKYDVLADSAVVWIEKHNLEAPGTTNLYRQELIPGHTYFLGSSGTLCDFDPSDGVLFDSHVSKPMLVATGANTGVVVNYRGLVCNRDDQPHKFIISVSATCNTIRVGDILRIKRKHIRTSVDASNKSLFADTVASEDPKPAFLGQEGGTTIYTLSNAASQYTMGEEDSPAEDDNYACDVLGIVTKSTTDDFEIQTSGMIEYELPYAQAPATLDNPNPPSTTIDGIFKPGYRYYLESFPINSDPGASTNANSLRSSIYDYSPEDFFDYINGVSTLLTVDMKPIMEGTSPFRNSTITDPFTRDATTGKVIAYSKPVFYAVTSTKILLLNHPAYPNPKDQCNAIDPATGSPCTFDRVETRNISITRTDTFNSVAEVESYSTAFLANAWMSADHMDVALITFVFEGTLSEGQEQFETYKFTKMGDNIESYWSYGGMQGIISA